MFSLQSVKPALLFVCAGVVTTAALHFPSTKHRFFLPPTLLVTAWALASIDDHATSAGPLGLDSYTGITCIIFTLILPRILLVEKHSLAYKARPDDPGKPTGTAVFPGRSSISAAWRIWNNPRNLSFSRPDPASAPSSWSVLARFAIFRAFKAGTIILVDRLLVQKVRGQLTASSSFYHFTPDQEPIVRRLFDGNDDPVSSHELLLRAFMSMSWIWANVLVLESYHALLSIVFVVIFRLDDPEDWPPLFGSLAEAWTVKRFWGKFWHRIATPTFASCSQLASRHLLQCRPGSSADNAVIALGVFLLSGVAHAIVAWRIGQGYAHLDLLFFSSNFVVVLAEILVSKLFKNSLRKTAYEARLRDPRVQKIGKALGFVWVFSWFFWAVPRWIYPKTLRWAIKEALLQSG